MLLKKVSIDGLRGYAREASLSPAIPNGTRGSGMTVIVGPNNSGKSTLVEAFRFRRGWGSPSFNVGMRNRLKDRIQIVFEFENQIETIRSINPGSSEAVVSNVNTTNAPVYFVPARRYFSPAFGRGSPSSRTDFINNYSASTETRSPQISQFEGRLLQIERDQTRFNSVMRKIIPDILSWSIDQHETGQYFLKFSSSSKSHSSEGVGEGIVSAFVIAAALYDSSSGDVIVIDEPELSLHPQIQKRMMSVFEELSADRQIIISTHSPYFVTASAITQGMKICRSWDRDGTIFLHSISAFDGFSHLTKLVIPNINNPHIFGLDAREVLFLEDRILVFEGQEDVVLWPDIARQLQAPDFQIYGWGAGGAENISNVLHVLRGLGFQYVVAILDADKPDELARLRQDFPEYHIDAIPTDDIRTKKASPARAGKLGLLDERRFIREEFRQESRELVERISNKLLYH